MECTDRVFRERKDPFELYVSDKSFRQRYRLTRQQVEEMALDYSHTKWANQGTRHAKGLSHRERVCLGLRFLASGALYSACGDTQGVNKSTVCRAVWALVNYLNSIKKRHVKWPKPEEYAKQAGEFYTISGFPKVVACIDGTHIGLRNPSRETNTYYNRKNYTSLNVMIACNADLSFAHVDARHPGSANDAHVFRMSPLSVFAEETRLNGYCFLGDAGYAQREFMMTPFLSPADEAEVAYNRAHTSTRCTVERAIGVLKQRFRCLDRSAGYIMSDPSAVSSLVIACSVLHNMAIRRGIDLDVDEFADIPPEMPAQAEEDNAHEGVGHSSHSSRPLIRGVRARERIVDGFFRRH